VAASTPYLVLRYRIASAVSTKSFEV
jgi:hypothetical protein